LPIFCYCPVQELKVQEQFWVQMNGILRNWEILPAPSEKNLPLGEKKVKARKIPKKE
jgi:hypothetical protein